MIKLPAPSDFSGTQRLNKQIKFTVTFLGYDLG